MFTSEQILRDYDCSYDEIGKGNVGGAGDGGVDSVYIFVNNALVDPFEDIDSHKGSLKIKVLIIQSKNKESFGEGVMDKLVAVTEDFFNLEKSIDSLKSVYNNALVVHIECFRNLYLGNIAKQPELNVQYYYASKSDVIHPNVNRKTKNVEDSFKKYFKNGVFSFDFITAEHLLSMSRRKKAESYIIKLKENPICTSDGGYICLAYLKDYFEFITDDNSEIQKYLFDANVRDYQGSTNVNEEISNTLRQVESSEFWWFNNGVTILTDKASVTSKTIIVSNPQIVNGCQTSYEIFSYFSKNSMDNENRSIAIKIIVTDNDGVRSKIIRSTNSQTNIPPTVLRATDQIHRNIEDYLQKYNIYYDRRKNYWKNENKPVKDIVTISTIAQCFIAMILQEPNMSRARPSSLVSNVEDYGKIFNTEYDLEGYLRIIKLQRRIEHVLSETSYLERGDKLNIRYFVYLHFVLKVRSNQQKIVKRVKEYFQEFSLINFEQYDDKSLMESIDKVYGIYCALGKSDATAKGKTFTDKVIEDIIQV
ncbi:MAG: AIPR family protein [Deferribacterales bacterium]